MNSPHLVVIGGPNGCGKTTFARAYAEWEGLKYLGADEVAARLSPSDPHSVRVLAGRIFGQELAQALEARRSLAVESTLSGGSFVRSIKRAQALGYEVTIVFVILGSPELCLQRIAERVAKGGHDVPEEDVRRRYSRALGRFWNLYRELADDWLLIDNGGSSFVRIADGDQNRTTVYDEETWWRFKEVTQMEGGRGYASRDDES